MTMADNPSDKSSIDKARNNASVDALYLELEAIMPITARPAGGDTVTWTVEVTDGAIDIEYGSAKYPDAALAHELLHARVQLDGYRRYLTNIAPPSKNIIVREILGALDNELQHHRMLPRFLDMGFRASQFYNDGDRHTFAKTKRQLEKMDSNDPIELFLLPFLSILSPGGVMSDQERNQLRNRCESRCARATWKRLVEIEGILHAWGESDSHDAGRTIADIFGVLGTYDGEVWIGTDQDFPGSGQFVGDPFTVEAALAWHQSMN